MINFLSTNILKVLILYLRLPSTSRTSVICAPASFWKQFCERLCQQCYIRVVSNIGVHSSVCTTQCVNGRNSYAFTSIKRITSITAYKLNRYNITLTHPHARTHAHTYSRTSTHLLYYYTFIVRKPSPFDRSWAPNNGTRAVAIHSTQSCARGYRQRVSPSSTAPARVYRTLLADSPAYLSWPIALIGWWAHTWYS